MSGESAQHVLLVERLVALVESRHWTKQGIMIFADHHSFAGNLPPMIGGYKPDLLAQDLPCTFQVIGEAKTAKDFEDERTVRQIKAFLDHLALYENTSFYLYGGSCKGTLIFARSACRLSCTFAEKAVGSPIRNS
jgi:hypothetical protein